MRHAPRAVSGMTLTPSADGWTYTCDAAPTQSALLAVLHGLPRGLEIEFFDRGFPTVSDPGAWVAVQRKGDRFLYRVGNHGWHADWVAQGGAALAAWMLLNVGGHPDDGPATIAVRKASQSPWYPAAAAPPASGTGTGDAGARAIVAADAPARRRPSNYPEPYASRMAGRDKQPLGDLFGLRNFGVNRTTLAPGAVSALRHAHATQDEFVYVLEGHPLLVTDAGETPLAPGMCAGFRAGTGDAHHLVNRSAAPAVYLEIGDRSAGDSATYPDDDLVARLVDGAWRFTRKDGTPY